MRLMDDLHARRLAETTRLAMAEQPSRGTLLFVPRSCLIVFANRFGAIGD
jgi:hypothetical protein